MKVWTNSITQGCRGSPRVAHQLKVCSSSKSLLRPIPINSCFLQSHEHFALLSFLTSHWMSWIWFRSYNKRKSRSHELDTWSQIFPSSQTHGSNNTADIDARKDRMCGMNQLVPKADTHPVHISRWYLALWSRANLALGTERTLNSVPSPA